MQLLRLQEGSHLWAAEGHEMGTAASWSPCWASPSAHSQSDWWEATFWIRHRWWDLAALHHRNEDQHVPFQATVCKAGVNITLVLTVVANPGSSKLFALHWGVDEKRHSSSKEEKDTLYLGFRGDKISLADKVETELAGKRWLCVNL